MTEQPTTGETTAPAITTPPTTTSSDAPWHQSLGLPEDLRGASVLQKYKTPADLVRGFENATRLIGADKVAVPKAEDDPAWADVFNRLGRPEDPKAYKLDVPADLQGKVAFDDALVGQFRDTAHKLGLSAKQAAGLYAFQAQITAAAKDAQEQASTAAVQETEAALKKEWGGSYDANVQLANRAVRELFDDADKDRMVESGLGRDPAFVRMMVKVAKAMSEDTAGGKPASRLAMGPAEARTRIAEIQADKDYWNKASPRYRPLVEESMRLHEIVTEQPA